MIPVQFERDMLPFNVRSLNETTFLIFRNATMSSIHGRMTTCVITQQLAYVSDYRSLG